MKIILNKWLSMDWKQWLRWICSILTLILSIITIVPVIVAIVDIAVEGYDQSIINSLFRRIFTPYEY